MFPWTESGKNRESNLNSEVGESPYPLLQAEALRGWEIKDRQTRRQRYQQKEQSEFTETSRERQRCSEKEIPNKKEKKNK